MSWPHSYMIPILQMAVWFIPAFFGVVRGGAWAASRIAMRQAAKSATQAAARTATSATGRQALSAANGLEAAIQAAEMVKDLVEKADKETGDTPIADVCVTCQQSPLDPKCEDKAKEIRVTRNELEQRNLDLYVDKHNLFNNYYDVRHPLGYGHWVGHIEQFENKQNRLRKLLAEYRKMGCPENGKPDDADRWGSRQPVDRPGNTNR